MCIRDSRSGQESNLFDSAPCKLPPNNSLGLSFGWLGYYADSKNYFTFPLEGSPLSFQGKTLYVPASFFPGMGKGGGGKVGQQISMRNSKPQNDRQVRAQHSHRHICRNGLFGGTRQWISEERQATGEGKVQRKTQLTYPLLEPMVHQQPLRVYLSAEKTS